MRAPDPKHDSWMRRVQHLTMPLSFSMLSLDLKEKFFLVFNNAGLARARLAIAAAERDSEGLM